MSVSHIYYVLYFINERGFKFKKYCTIIEGIDPKEIDIKDLAKKLKGQFACGGTVKDGKVELQGDHRSKVKSILVGMGFPVDSIEVR